MTDPRWQRAMERLGLVEVVYESHGDGVYQRNYPDPKKPATFQRVVEALLKQNISVYLEPGVVTIGRYDVAGLPVLESMAATLYEAVMEAFVVKTRPKRRKRKSRASIAQARPKARR